jgi:nucleoside-diphosphate kinase
LIAAWSGCVVKIIKSNAPDCQPRLAFCKAIEVDLPGIDLLCHRSKPIERKDELTMERTLSIIKPDGVARGLIGKVIQRIEALGLKIVAIKMVHMSRFQAEGFYAVHRERPFFESLAAFMSSGPAVVMVLQGENAIARWRELMGATDYRKAAEGTLRREFATDIEKNVVHGSDAPETAAFEIAYFFNRFEIIA